MPEILTTGGEVYTKQFDDCRVYDRIRLEDGVAICINKTAYTKDVYPLQQVEQICTHTSDDEENATWW